MQGSYASTLKLYHTHTLGGVPNNVYQVEDTTRGSLLNSFVDLIASPFTSPEENTQAPYYPQPIYVYPTTSILNTPQPAYYTQTFIKRTKNPIYKTQPKTSPTTSSPEITSSISTSRGGLSDRLNDFNSQCGMPRRKVQEAVSLVVNGMAAAKGQVKCTLTNLIFMNF